MPWQPDYVVVADVRSYVRIPSGDTADDAILSIAASSASRAIDQFCNRQFGTATGTRVYLADGSHRMRIDDVQSVSAVVVDGETLSASDYVLTPRNALANGRPYEVIEFSDSLRWAFKCGAEVYITGAFGWSSVPVAVKQAALLQASRLVSRRDSPHGVAGAPEAGSELRLLARVDPDVEVSLRPYRRMWGAL